MGHRAKFVERQTERHVRNELAHIAAVGAGERLGVAIRAGHAHHVEVTQDHVLELRDHEPLGGDEVLLDLERRDRKSTRLNSSHVAISYAVSRSKKKNSTTYTTVVRINNRSIEVMSFICR